MTRKLLPLLLVLSLTASIQPSQADDFLSREERARYLLESAGLPTDPASLRQIIEGIIPSKPFTDSTIISDRELAADLIGLRGDSGACELLLDAAQSDAHIQERLAYARALGRLGASGDAVLLLRGILEELDEAEDEDLDGWLEYQHRKRRIRAARALIEFGESDAFGVLLEELQGDIERMGPVYELLASMDIERVPDHFIRDVVELAHRLLGDPNRGSSLGVQLAEALIRDYGKPLEEFKAELYRLAFPMREEQRPDVLARNLLRAIEDDGEPPPRSARPPVRWNLCADSHTTASSGQTSLISSSGRGEVRDEEIQSVPSRLAADLIGLRGNAGACEVLRSVVQRELAKSELEKGRELSMSLPPRLTQWTICRDGAP